MATGSPSSKSVDTALCSEQLRIISLINLNETVNRYTDIDNAKGDTDSFTKNLVLSRYGEN